MSMDTADDLEYAENLIGALAVSIRALIETNGLGSAAASSALLALAHADAYCRPTCRFLGEGECAEGDTCGCLCGHRAEAAVA